VGSYAQDAAAQAVWGRIDDLLKDVDGICYYKHPIISAISNLPPDFTLLADGFEPLAIRIITYRIDEIKHIDPQTWVINEQSNDSPVLELDDYVAGLRFKFDRDRTLRDKFLPQGALVFPLISRADFESAFGSFENVVGDVAPVTCVYGDLDLRPVLQSVERKLDEREWLLAKSIFQGISPINKRPADIPTTATTMGGAISALEKEIALLDQDQHKVAIQIAPGPQRIRGLAGTGKTVVLAMKAANIHLRFPDARILFTFNTQSLYNQVRSLITKFYRVNSEEDPNWDVLHVRHAWGSSSRPGVYYDLTRRLGIAPLDLRSAQARDRSNPLRACCRQVLAGKIERYYDYILVDEAQDFPIDYFRVLARLISTPEKKIYFAYDELQSLSSVEIPNAEELFGNDDVGKPFISLEGDDYPGRIEKDFVLHRSYRCPLDVLELAHGIGLGIHNPHGCVQMVQNKTSWESLGYEIREGNFVAGEKTVIERPSENSPNNIKALYRGDRRIIEVHAFDFRGDEISWIAESIEREVRKEGVRPEQIVVIALPRQAKDVLMPLQAVLLDRGIASTIPGISDASWEFAERDRVTLATVYRAKGNEAPVVYIAGFDYLYSYADEVESRNRAFTSLSRSKGFVRITGTGVRMNAAASEINDIVKDIPRLIFDFPDMKDLRIRKLDASETSRRKREITRAVKSVSSLLALDEDALRDLDRGALEKLKQKLNEATGDNQ
jgi:superfamily I DNA and RNA helicase